MRKYVFACVLLVLFASAGCGYKPITKTFKAIKKVHNTTKQVYRTTKAVADLVNPLEYIYVSVPADEGQGEPAGPAEIWVYDRQTGELVGVIPGDQGPPLAAAEH